MAQTIAIQRGELSFTWNDTLSTIFTQSGGTATRVIFGGYNSYTTGGPGSNVGMMTFIQNSAGNRWTPVSLWSGTRTSQNIYGFSVFPSQSNTTREGYGGATALYNTGNAIGSASGAGYLGTTAITNAIIMGGNGNANLPFGATSNIDLQPSQFWMGPGDSLVIRVTSSSSGASYLAYNFVTITES